MSFSLCFVVPRVENLLIQKIFETNSSFHVKQRTTAKVFFFILQEILASINKIFIFGGRPGARL